MLLVAVVPLLFTATACGPCTAIGCSDSVFVELQGVSLNGRPGAVAARMCLDGVCKDQRLTFQAQGATVDGLENGLGVVAFEGATHLEYAWSPDARDEGRKHVTVEVSFNNGPTFRAETEVEVTKDYPNGRRCGGPCWAGSTSVPESELQTE